MDKPQNRDKVFKSLQDALGRDKAKTNVLKISELGLVEMTRKRVRESVTRMMNEPCSYCEGKGHIKSKITIAYEIFREIRREAVHFPEPVLVVNCHPEVARILQGAERDELRYLMDRFNKTIQVKPQQNYHQEQFDIYGRHGARRAGARSRGGDRDGASAGAAERDRDRERRDRGGGAAGAGEAAAKRRGGARSRGGGRRQARRRRTRRLKAPGGGRMPAAPERGDERWIGADGPVRAGAIQLALRMLGGESVQPAGDGAHLHLALRARPGAGRRLLGGAGVHRDGPDLRAGSTSSCSRTSRSARATTIEPYLDRFIPNAHVDQRRARRRRAPRLVVGQPLPERRAGDQRHLGRPAPPLARAAGDDLLGRRSRSGRCCSPAR